MAKFTITCTLTAEQETILAGKFAPKTIKQVFQEFWDGYDVGQVHQDGAVWAQIKQWLLEYQQTQITSSALLDKA